MSNTPNDLTPKKRIAIVGAGPGGLSALIALSQAGFDVRLFERQPEIKAMGGAVLLNLPVMCILRGYGVDLEKFGATASSEFRTSKGRLRFRIPFNEDAQKKAGLPGWNYGMLRSSLYARMLPLAPQGSIMAGHRFVHFTEEGETVRLHFDNGSTWDADLLIAADGNRSTVMQQVLGDLGLFPLGLQVWLGWCHADALPRETSMIMHSSDTQFGFHPILHDGQAAWEWWMVERCPKGAPLQDDVGAYLRRRLTGWAEPVPTLMAATDMGKVFRWELFNRPLLRQWTYGRVTALGDAVHPTSPYAGYGAGMAIEDGYFLGRFLRGVDLSDRAALAAALARYEAQRVDYTNHTVLMARRLGRLFHQLPWPLTAVRDTLLTHARFPQKFIVRDYFKNAEQEMLALEV
jgi:2-polyprenyl-6-methoxyphenol hydroxylase-like FAD-dependent oxidoreductase